MKLSAALTVIWKLAIHEAATTAFRELEPEHFLTAVLKFSELPAFGDAQDPSGTEVARQLAAEVTAVRQELTQRGLDSVALRRRLRARLGKGDHSPTDGTLHRSAASKAIFTQAARLATERHKPFITATLLLDALWAAPTPAMIEVMGNALGAPAPALPVVPHRVAQGQDLVEWATSGKLPALPDRPVEGRALGLVLGGQLRVRNVLLVGEENAIMAAVFALARTLALGQAAPALGTRRFIDLRNLAQDAGQSQPWPGRLAALLDEAADAADEAILLLPPLQASWESERQQAYLNLLKTAWRTGNMRCLLPVEPLAYRQWIAPDPGWRRLAQVMWIAASMSGDIPEEL